MMLRKHFRSQNCVPTNPRDKLVSMRILHLDWVLTSTWRGKISILISEQKGWLALPHGSWLDWMITCNGDYWFDSLIVHPTKPGVCVAVIWSNKFTLELMVMINSIVWCRWCWPEVWSEFFVENFGRLVVGQRENVTHRRRESQTYPATAISSSWAPRHHSSVSLLASLDYIIILFGQCVSKRSMKFSSKQASEWLSFCVGFGFCAGHGCIAT